MRGMAHGNGAGIRSGAQSASARSVPSLLPDGLARVLVVDDFESFRLLVSSCLQPLGIAVAGAATGDEGLALARSFKPDIIILDWVLKGSMSGLNAVRELRKDDALKSIATIMVSSIKDPSDALRARAAGANLFLTKDQLQNVLQAYVERAAAARSGAARILIVEDDEEQQDFIRYSLSGEGCELEFAKDGATGLKSARLRAPALILLDLGLPGMNGVEVFKFLKDDAATRHVPVLIMTAMADDARVVDSLVRTLRPADYIRKPFGDRELAERIARLLAQPATAVPAGAGSPVLEKGRIRIDLATRTASVSGGKPLRLGDKQFELLCALLRRPDGLSRQELIVQLWNGSENGKVIDVTVQRLRQSLGLSRDEGIIAIPHGYKLVG